MPRAAGHLTDPPAQNFSDATAGPCRDDSLSSQYGSFLSIPAPVCRFLLWPSAISPFREARLLCDVGHPIEVPNLNDAALFPRQANEIGRPRRTRCVDRD